MKKVVIVAAKRTPMGSFGGSLSSLSATKLGAIAIKGAFESINLNPNLIEEVFMGNVLQANLGQAPAKQAAIYAGINENTPCTTVNKVCASGMKAVSLAVQSIMTGDVNIVVAGGMENMSMVPHYYNARKSKKLGDVNFVDGLIKDGLTDVYNEVHMGKCADHCAEEYKISREQQDEFAIESYNKAAHASKNGLFEEEIVPVSITQRKGDALIIKEDEEYKNVKLDKIPQLKAVFSKDGTVTAANASTLNDGASALIIMSEEKAKELNLKPLVRVVSYADASQEAMWFTTSPAIAINKALSKANILAKDVDYWELNEAFASVVLRYMDHIGIDHSDINVNGGAIAMGHPLGATGAMILGTVLDELERSGKSTALATLCVGGGMGTATIIERV